MNKKEIKKLLSEKRICMIMASSRPYEDDMLIFNEYSIYSFEENNAKPAIFKKWCTGYSWERHYDENWDDYTTEQYNDPDPEPEFDNLKWYLKEHGVDYDSLTEISKMALKSLEVSTTYANDPYYGSDEENVVYITYENLDLWLANYQKV